MRNKLVCAALVSAALARPAAAEEALRPGMIVQFTKGAVACAGKEDLLETAALGLLGNRAGIEAMQVENGGDCFTLPPTLRYRVLSVEPNNPNPDLGLVRVADEGGPEALSAWAFTVGAEEAKAAQKGKGGGRSGARARYTRLPVR